MHPHATYTPAHHRLDGLSQHLPGGVQVSSQTGSVQLQLAAQHRQEQAATAVKGWMANKKAGAAPVRQRLSSQPCVQHKEC